MTEKSKKISLVNRASLADQNSARLNESQQSADPGQSNHDQRTKRFAPILSRQESQIAPDLISGLVSTAYDLIFRCDLQGRFLFLSDNWEAALGYSIGEMLGQRESDFLSPEFVEQISHEREKLRTSGGPVEYHAIFLSKAREPVTLSIRAVALFDENGEMVGTLGTAHDVTSLMQNQERLSEINSRLIQSQIELENKNTALSEFIDHLDREKRDIGMNIQANLDRLVDPMLSKIETIADEAQANYIKAVRSMLTRIMSPYVDKLEQQFSRLTPREIEICTMIRNGMTSKEIGLTLNTTEGTVRSQRKTLRKKLSLAHSKINLATYLRDS